MKTIKKNGLVFKVDDDDGSAYAILDRGFKAEDITVPPEIDGISVRAFYLICSDIEYRIKNAIKNIRLPESVNELKFSHNYNQSIHIEIDERNPYFYTDGKAVYSKDRSELLSFLALGDEEYSVLDGCKKVSDHAFKDAGKLRRVFLPKSLKTIGAGAFSECHGLEELKLSEGLTEIGEYAFQQCYKLKNLTLPSTLEILKLGAFKDCSHALTVELPKALREIGVGAFPNDWTLILNKDNKYLISTDDLILSGDGRMVIHTARPVSTEVLTIPDGVTEIAPWVFWQNDNIKKVILPKTLHTVSELAFAGMYGLREINLENVRKIGYSAFRRCASIKKISLKCDKPDPDTFIGCSSLNEAELDCETVGESMFEDCVSLKKVVLKNTRVIGKEAFQAATALKEIVLPYGLEEIEERALAQSGIKILTIPKTVRRIGNNIADGIGEIHIYDNIETDIGIKNDISGNPYTLYVHSAKTDEIKYAIPIIEDAPGYGRAKSFFHETLLELFKKGADFDFQEYDRYFCDCNFYGDVEKFNAGRLRLKYGFELDGEMRRKYKEHLDRLAPSVMEELIKDEKIKELFDPEFYEFLSIEQMLPLIDISARYHLTELTAFLMQICNEKRQ